MNLTKLFKTQAELDKKIIEEKGLQGQDLLDKKILALQVELGELANEWRGFKFWSEDQEPRIFVPNPDDVCKNCKGDAYFNREKDMKEWIFCNECDGCGVHFHNPLLEEYVDVIHFTLSVGLEIEIKHEILPEPINYGDVVIQFNELFGQISYFASVLNRENEWEEVESEYERIWSLLFGLAGLLGFTWEQIEQAYYEKNKINHERQENGY